MLNFLLVLIIIACILLIIIVMAQNPKGSGLSNFGAGASQFLGARKTADFLEKSTWYFGIGILVIIIFSYFMVSPTNGGMQSRIQNSDYTPVMNEPSAPATNPLQHLPAPQKKPENNTPQK